MKVLKILFYITLLVFYSNSHSTENRILLKINNQIITTYDLMIEITYLRSINSDYEKLNLDKTIEIAKDSLIKEKIKEIELKKYLDEIKLEKKQLNKILINYFKKFGIKTIADFDQYFAAKKINPEKIKKKLH